MDPLLPSLGPVTRGYRILLKRTISLIEHGAFGVHNNSIPEGHPSLSTPGNRVPRSDIMGIQHSSVPHTQGG